MRLFSKANRQAAKILAMSLAMSLLVPATVNPAEAKDEVFGPPNMLKTFATPFTAGTLPSASANDVPETEPLSLSGHRSLASRLRLTDRTVPPRVFLPGRMILGRPEEFIVKGKPGSWAAIAMADKNSGAKDIAGHKIRLGPDRKLVSLVRIGESGIAQMYIETPVQGDMVGSNFYFEAVVWSKDDFSDAEVCQTVSPEQTVGADNGVLVAAETEVKKGIKFGTAASVQPSQHTPAGSFDPNKP